MKEKIDIKLMVEDIVGCKWSLSVLDMLNNGINRPGAMTREKEGLSAKVLNERLRKLIKYNVIEKQEFEEVPPRVEYVFTSFGLKFLKIIQEIQKLEEELSSK